MIKRQYRLVSLLILLFSSAGHALADENYTLKTHTENHKAPDYTITINYPVFTHSVYAKNINRVIHTTVERKVSQIHYWMLRGEPPNRSSEFDSDVAVISHQQGRYSLVWFNTNFYAGAAHPEHTITPLNVDIKHHHVLTLANLVSANDAYHQFTSYCQRALKQQFKRIGYDDSDQISRAWFYRGTAPNHNNYSLWSFTPNSLHFYFPNYQIAPYAVGEFICTIPVSQLTSDKGQLNSH